MITDQCAANWCTNFNCSLGFGDGLGLWLSLRHLLLSEDRLGLGFWVTGLRGSFLRFPPIVLTTKPGVPRQGFGLWFWSEVDGRRTSTSVKTLCSRSRCGAREALTVGYQPTRVRGRKVKSRDCALASDLVRVVTPGNGLPVPMLVSRRRLITYWPAHEMIA